MSDSARALELEKPGDDPESGENTAGVKLEGVIIS